MNTFKIKQTVSSRNVFCKFSDLILVLVLLSVLAGCSSSTYFKVPPPVPDDRQPVQAPKPRRINIAADVVRKQFFDQLKQSFDISRQVRNISGAKKEAYNVNAFGEVPNSSWFTNRNHVKRMTLKEIARGPNQIAGPDATGEWILISAKVEGVTPGFSIKDKNGERFVIKFDPQRCTVMATGAEVVSTKLFYAAGYYVPENYITYFNPKILKLGAKVQFTDSRGKKRLMTEEDLQNILSKVQILPDGRIRAVASRYLKGKLVGPFYYKGTRKDDANDMIPHQHRRELRGLRVIAAWLNHFDTKANNTLDVYLDEGYVRHCLIDFGSTLGSNGDQEMPPVIGHENSFDPHEVGLNTVSLGLNVRPYEKTGKVIYPSIGYYESKLFHPQKYKFIQPNPAFELMTDRDGFLGAKIVTSFTDEQIRAAVAMGKYSNPEAAEYLVKTIRERRDIVGRYWFDKVNPLDKFKIQKTADNRQELCFTDLAVEAKLESVRNSQYRYDLSRDGTPLLMAQNLGNSTLVPLPEKQEVRNKKGTRKHSGNGQTQWQIQLQVKRNSDEKWSKSVMACLIWNEVGQRFKLIGVRR